MRCQHKYVALHKKQVYSAVIFQEACNGNYQSSTNSPALIDRQAE